jgi:hypothetical protein
LDIELGTIVADKHGSITVNTNVEVDDPYVPSVPITFILYMLASERVDVET